MCRNNRQNRAERTQVESIQEAKIKLHTRTGKDKYVDL